MDEQLKSKDKIFTFSPLVQNVFLFFFFIHTLYLSKTCLVPGVVLDTLTSTLTMPALHTGETAHLLQ